MQENDGIQGDQARDADSPINDHDEEVRSANDLLLLLLLLLFWFTYLLIASLTYNYELTNSY